MNERRIVRERDFVARLLVRAEPRTSPCARAGLLDERHELLDPKLRTYVAALDALRFLGHEPSDDVLAIVAHQLMQMHPATCGVALDVVERELEQLRREAAAKGW